MSSMIKVNKHDGLLFHAKYSLCFSLDQQIVHSSAHSKWFTGVYVEYFTDVLQQLFIMEFNVFSKCPSCFMRFASSYHDFMNAE